MMHMPVDPAWTDENLNNPHAVTDKAQRVERMFAAIAPRYDLNNHLHSLWRDQAWRRAAVKLAQLKPTDTVLDVACGTGDLTMCFAAAGAQRVIGIDFTHEMLTLARQKAPALSFQRGDAMNLPIADAAVDVVSIAFGLRNVADPRKALAEFHRVLLPGGRLIVLEFATPTNRLVRAFDRIYRERIMPVTAAWIAGDKVGAYRYLPRSVSTFADPRKMAQMLGEAGFREVTMKPMTCGIAVVYRGIRVDG